MKILNRAIEIKKEYKIIHKQVERIDVFINNILNSESKVKLKARIKEASKNVTIKTGDDFTGGFDSIRSFVIPHFKSSIISKHDWFIDFNLSQTDAVIVFSALLHVKKQQLKSLEKEFTELELKSKKINL